MASTGLAALALPRTVLVLGCVSLLNDGASEMVTPLMPVFLVATLGAGPAVVGLIEGLAEATASVLKLVSGWLADRGVSARKLVIGGYSVSNVARPLIGLALAWGAVLTLRFLDRVGKGIRSAPRDALIAGAVPEAHRGRAFGFHRSMDHSGAVIGPLLAFGLLSAGLSIREVILASGIMGLLVVGLLVFGFDSPRAAPLAVRAPLRWSSLDVRLKRLLGASSLLAVATAPEAFLVLWATARDVPVASIALLWALTSSLKLAVAYPAGVASDRLGRTATLVLGWVVRIVLLVSLAAIPVDNGPVVWVLFILYGGSLALTEAAERSLVADAAPIDQRATAFGIYHLLTGLLMLPGAVLFGTIWHLAGSAAAFYWAATLTAVAVAWILGLRSSLPGRRPA